MIDEQGREVEEKEKELEQRERELQSKEGERNKENCQNSKEVILILQLTKNGCRTLTRTKVMRTKGKLNRRFQTLHVGGN